VAVKRSRQVSDRLVKGVGFLMKKNKIDVYMGLAHLTKPGAVSVTARQRATERAVRQKHHRGDRRFLAGPPAWKWMEEISSPIWKPSQERLPKSIIIIGAGAVGVEFATVWNAYGAEVTIVEMLPSLLPMEDEEVPKN
jgi:dihydrolipoamide dehydrogenase